MLDNKDVKITILKDDLRKANSRENEIMRSWSKEALKWASSRDKMQSQIERLEEREAATVTLINKMIIGDVACDGVLMVDADEYNKLVLHINKEG